MSVRAQSRPAQIAALPRRVASSTDVSRETVEAARPEQLQIIVLDCPLEHWDEPAVRSLFCAMVDIKRIGFDAHYDAKVLPLDTTDFIGRHVLTCLPDSHGLLRVLAGYRAIDSERCKAFNLRFPAESLALAAGSAEHAAAVREFVDGGGPVGYLGSWTAHPAVRGNVQLRGALRDHFAMGGVLLHHESGVPRVMVGATLRFKVDRLLRPVGYRPLAHGGRPLPALRVGHLQGEFVQLMALESCAEALLEQPPRPGWGWERRIVL